jgi:type IV secretion system protein VirD4
MRIPLLSQAVKKEADDDLPTMARLPGYNPGVAAARGVGAAVLSGILTSWGVVQFGALVYHFHYDLPGHWQGHMWYPWAFWEWFGKLGWGYYDLFATMQAVAVVSSAAMGFAAYRIMETKAEKSYEKKKLDIHGSAAWATAEEARRSALLNDDGVFLGTIKDEAGNFVGLRHNGPEHIKVMAPTRSGKGVAIIIPTLLTWKPSMVVYDMKGELWALTAQYRAQALGNRVLRFCPSSRDSVHFNPLDEINIFSDPAVADAQNIALMIVDTDGAGLDDHWKLKAHELITAGILYVLLPRSTTHSTDKSKPTLTGVADLLTSVNDDDTAISKKNILTLLLQCRHMVPRHLQEEPMIKSVIHFITRISAQLHEIEDRELSSIFSTTTSKLTLFFDPIISSNTSDSTFRISDLMGFKTGDEEVDRKIKPVSLYMVIPQREKERIKPIVRLMFTMITRTLAQQLEYKDGRGINPYVHRLLMALDEFPTLGALPIIEEALAYMAGYGMKAMIIIQDQPQLIKAYGVHESITSNCHTQVAFAPNNPETAEMLSKMAGNMTVYHRTESISGKNTNIYGLENLNQSDQYYSRPLITPDEVMRIPAPQKEKLPNGDELIVAPGAELIFVAGMKPIFARQDLYFQDPVFLAATKYPAPPAFDGQWTPIIRNTALAELPFESPDKYKDDPEPEIIITDMAGFASLLVRIRDKPGVPYVKVKKGGKNMDESVKSAANEKTAEELETSKKVMQTAAAVLAVEQSEQEQQKPASVEVSQEDAAAAGKLYDDDAPVPTTVFMGAGR